VVRNEPVEQIFLNGCTYISSPGGVAQWTSHPPLEHKTRVRIPPGYKVFRENIAMRMCVIDVIMCAS
jgi:hypothetical protein